MTQQAGFIRVTTNMGSNQQDVGDQAVKIDSELKSIDEILPAVVREREFRTTAVLEFWLKVSGSQWMQRRRRRKSAPLHLDTAIELHPFAYQYLPRFNFCIIRLSNFHDHYSPFKIVRLASAFITDHAQKISERGGPSHYPYW